MVEATVNFCRVGVSFRLLPRVIVVSALMPILAICGASSLGSFSHEVVKNENESKIKRGMIALDFKRLRIEFVCGKFSIFTVN